MAKKSKSKGKTENQGLRQETGLGMGNDPDDLVNFFQDQVPNPKFGEPGEPKYLNRPAQPGETIIDDAGNEVVVPDAPEYEVGDRVIDEKTGEIRELHEDGTWGPLTGTVKDGGKPESGKDDEPAEGQEAGKDKPEGDDQGNVDPKIDNLQKQLQSLQDAIQNAVPERLRRDNPAESLVNLGKSYGEAEKKISEQGAALNKYSALLAGSNMLNANPGMRNPQYGPMQGTGYPGSGMTLPDAPTEEELASISDEDMTYKPKEATNKLVLGSMAKYGPAMAEQIVNLLESRQLAAFRMSNPEWDELWQTGEIQAVINANRHLDSAHSCPEVLKRAKILREQRLDQQRREAFGGQDPEAIQKQQKELFDGMTSQIASLEKELKSLKEGIPEAVEKVHSQKVKNMQAFAPAPNASGGGAAAVEDEETVKKQRQPQMSPEEMEFEAIRNAQPPGRTTAKQDPSVKGILAMMKGKTWDDDSGRFV